MQVRVARHTKRLDEVVAFYRDGLGLPEIGRFDDHDGYDGVFLAIPGTDAHSSSRPRCTRDAHSPSGDASRSLSGHSRGGRKTCERVGTEPLEATNPYWREHGVTLADPDGFRVVLVAGRWPDHPAA